MRINTILSLSVVILLITVVFAGVVPAAAQYDTMQFRYNAQHTGDYSPVAGPVPSNGQLLWKCATGFVDSSPAVANEVVYVENTIGYIIALNATTGNTLWRANPTNGVESSSPAVANGVVYVGSNYDTVYALNATTGHTLWRNTTPTGGSGTDSSPAVANGVVYVGNTNGAVYALNATNGTELWRNTTGLADSSPAVANGVVYGGNNYGYFYALNANNGTQLWNDQILPVQSSPAVANGVVYVGVVDEQFGGGYVNAFYATNGTELWRNMTGLADSSPAVANGVVYVGNTNGGVYALNATTGGPLWNYTTGGAVQSSPAVANGVVYVGSNDNNTYAFNATTGTKLWNYTTGGAVQSSPAVANGVVYVGSNDGNVYAIGNDSVSVRRPQPTTLNATVSTTTVYVNQNFTINGTLNTTLGPVAGATIQCQKNVSGTWTNVTGKTNTTASNGAYRISTSEPTAGTYQYRTIYAGKATGVTLYKNATSNVVSVTVVSKASVLADINTLQNTINRLPNSAFIPGTKTVLFSLLSITELQVRFNLYRGAATTLQSAVLPHMDGCSATGKPDSNDWVRTCSAQGQLYPQVQNLIRELQALQGS
jgi:outer membrane protein assembly factor BamB